MPLRPILRYPDPRLREPAQAITDFGQELSKLASDLLETMRAAPGIGITAPHIGVAQRLVVIELPEQEPRFFANPEIMSVSTETTRHPEGSVSMPGVSEEVERPASVTIRYRSLDGAEHEEPADGLLAICLQHEIDQLDGVFWIARLSRLKRDRAIKRYEKLQRR